MTTVEVVLPALHRGGQREVHLSPARFRVLAAGRRWGKTLLGVSEVISTAVAGGRAWWVAPSYKMARVGWRGIFNFARQIADAVPGVEVRRGDWMVVFPGGGEAWVRSADDPHSLRGEGLDLAVLDECAFMHEAAWFEALRPALSDRNGRALFISTPKGRNWFWRLWSRGNEGKDEWTSFRYPTESNPYIDPREIDEARRSLPERIFFQEYMAQFIDDAGGVFRRVVDAAVASPQDVPVSGHEYIFGVDWGRHEDYTVIAVLDASTKELVYIDRFSKVKYSLQVGRLKALADKFRARLIVAEANAMGGPLVESLQESGLPVEPFTTTHSTKSVIIDALALAFERGEIRILPDQMLIAELQAYEMRRTPSGSFRYGAPEGMHDDMVIALALAWWGARAHGTELVYFAA